MPDYTTTNTPSRSVDNPTLPAVVEALDATLKKVMPPFLGEILADVQARTEYGLQKYGVPLRPYDGADAIKEAYQEALDGAVYLTQALMELSITPIGTERTDVTDSSPTWAVGVALSSLLVTQIMMLSSLRSVLNCRDMPGHPSPITVEEIFTQGVDLSE